VSASQEDATGLDDRTPGRRRTHQTGLDSLLGVHVRLGDPTVSKQRRLASLAEAAAYQGGVSTKTVRRQIARGDITGYKLPGSRLLRVDLNELDELLRPIPTVGGAA